MKQHLFAACLVLCPVAALAAQEGETRKPAKLRIVKDAENVLAQKIAGRWVLDAELTRRLGGLQKVETIAIECTNEIVQGLPDGILARLENCPISAAGTVSLRGRTYPFLLVRILGNDQVVYFRERDGNPVGDAESFIVTLASAKDTKGDLLFVGGDFAKQPFAAFARSSGEPVAGGKGVRGAATPEQAIAHMTRLLAEKKYLEMVETYMSPADKERILNDKKETLEEIAEQFGQGKAAVLAELLAKLADKKPELTEDGNSARYAAGEGGRDLVLTKVDGRWFIKN